jgi:chaperonin cofactor prefoldin
MGNNVVDELAQEIMTRFQSEVQGLLEKVKAENARLEARVCDVEQELCKVCEALTKAEDDAEGYRRWGQKLYVQLNPPTEADLEFWRNAKASDFPLSWDDLRAILHESPSGK